MFLFLLGIGGGILLACVWFGLRSEWEGWGANLKRAVRHGDVGEALAIAFMPLLLTISGAFAVLTVIGCVAWVVLTGLDFVGIF